jgi:hypothetical protein
MREMGSFARRRRNGREEILFFSRSLCDIAAMP